MTVYYFSATGNSLNIAENINAVFSDVRLVSIPNAIRDKNYENTDDTVGFVFPVHVWGMPSIVEEFVDSVEISHAAYVFAVAVCAGTPGDVLHVLDRKLRKKGSWLNSGFAVRENSYSPLKPVAVERFIIWLNRNHKALTWEEKKDSLLDVIRERKNNVFDRAAFLSCIIGTYMLHESVISILHNMHKDFYIENTCTLCHICEKICPRKNISVVDGKICIGSNCELCFACAGWCPKGAIKIKNGCNDMSEKHNTKITFKDLL